MARPLLGLPAPPLAEQLRALLLLSLSLGLTAALATQVPGMTLAPALGASAILVAALPNAPVARLWPLLGGTLLAALLATLISQLAWPVWLSAPLTLSLALLLMYRLRCLHPPAGAMALWLLLANDATAPIWAPLLNCLPGLLLLALLGRLHERLPILQSFGIGHGTRDKLPTQRHEPSTEDWQNALDNHPELLDVGPTQLHALYRSLEARRLNAQVHSLRVRDIMSREVIALSPYDTAKQAWRTLQQHRIKTLPVAVEDKVVGVISLVDLLKHLGMAWHTLPEDLNARAHIVMEQEVATLMSKPARSVPMDLPLDELVPLLSDWGLHHVPVVDENEALVGMVTQSDLIAGMARLLSKPRHSPE